MTTRVLVVVAVLVVCGHDEATARSVYTRPSRSLSTDWAKAVQSIPDNDLSARGEVPVELLNDPRLDFAPISGGAMSWKAGRAALGGQRHKVACRLYLSNTTEEGERAAGQRGPMLLSPTGEPYAAIVRPSTEQGYHAGVLELMAMHVADVIGIHKIPTMSLVKKPQLAASVNVQSMIRGVRPVFLKDWETCLPRQSAMPRLASSHVKLPAPPHTTRTRTLHVNSSASYAYCYQNTSIDVWEYPAPEHPCLTARAHRRGCYDDEISQLLEMMAFDALILNHDRIKVGTGASNNVHVVPMRVGGSYDDWKLVWIDNGHMTFENRTDNPLLDFFNETCVFPSSFAELLLAPAVDKVSTQVLDRLSDPLVLQMETVLGKLGRVGTKLQRVDEQLEKFRKIAAHCVAMNPRGTLDIITPHAR